MFTLSQKHDPRRGATLPEALVAAAIVGGVIVAILKITDYTQKTMADLRDQTTRTLITERYYALAQNPAAWAKTVAGDADLDAHTTVTSGAEMATHPVTPLALRDAGDAATPAGNVVVETTGLHLDRLGNPTAAASYYWNVKATWQGIADFAARVVVTVERGNAPGTALEPRVAELFRPSQRTRCVTRTATLVGDGAHGGDYGPYAWDSVTVSCPAGYTRTGNAMQPGCGALSPRLLPTPTDDTSATCYQISANRPNQKAISGCGAGTSPNGTCIVTCCNFD